KHKTSCIVQSNPPDDQSHIPQSDCRNPDIHVPLFNMIRFEELSFRKRRGTLKAIEKAAILSLRLSVFDHEAIRAIYRRSSMSTPLIFTLSHSSVFAQLPIHSLLCFHNRILKNEVTRTAVVELSLVSEVHVFVNALAFDMAIRAMLDKVFQF
ncbi:10140_t:CDS:2, partial [Paraglomus brasilianum]